MTVPYRDAFLDPSAPSFSRTTTTTTNSTTKWGPYAGARDFGISMVIVLVILFCTLLLAITAVAFIRLILSARRDRQQRRQAQPADPEKPAPLRETHLPTLAFSEGAKLAGVGAECAICLTEFVDGDGVRVLPACNHGFHVRCIEEWLASRCSCPTCRRSCLVAAEPPTGKVGIEVV